MKRLVFFLFLSLMMTSAKAVDYRSVGSNADFCVYTFDGEYYLVLSFRDDDKNRLSEQTVVKFQLKDGSIMRLTGYDGSKKTSVQAYYWGEGMASENTSEKHYAVVYITPEQIEQLKNGIEKVAINTIPEVYKRSKWTGKEKFGIGLYNDFKALKNEFEE